MRGDDEIWEDWADRLDQLCLTLSKARRKAGAMRKQFAQDAGMNINPLFDVQDHVRSALAITEGMDALYEEADGQEE